MTKKIIISSAIQTGTSRLSGQSVTTTPSEKHEHSDNVLFKAFPVELPPASAFWSRRIKHEFKDIFEENDGYFSGKNPNLNAYHRI